MIGFGNRQRTLLAALVACPALIYPQAAWVQDTAGSSAATSRSIADITAILDREMPAAEQAARMRAEADAQPKDGIGQGDLAGFHYERCQARWALGELRDAVADCERAVQLGVVLGAQEFARLLQGLAHKQADVGDFRKALDSYLRLIHETDQRGSGKGFQFNANFRIAKIYMRLGNFNQAEAYFRRNDLLMQQARSWSSYAVGFNRASWHATIELGRANVFTARGQYVEAEASYKRVEALRREAESLVHTYRGTRPPTPDQLELNIDWVVAHQGQMKERQGRMVEGEADVRRALLNRLNATGKYNVEVTWFISFLARILLEQGRLAEAEKLTRAQIDINRKLGIAKDSHNMARPLSRLASLLNLQGRWDAAAEVYAELDEAIAAWPAERKDALNPYVNRIETLYRTNNLTAGIVAAERLVKHQSERLGDQHLETALAHGVLAMGLARAGRDAEAEQEFGLAIPILWASSRETDMDDAFSYAGSNLHIDQVIEDYMALLVRNKTPEAAGESFRLADLIRGRAVQNALAASSARTASLDPALAEIARKEQDLGRQLTTQLGVLNGALALPSSERDEKAVRALSTDIDELRAARDAAKRELASRFSNYAELVEPRPATVDDLRSALAANEVFLSFYFGRESSFVWAVTKEGPVAFMPVRLSVGELKDKVQILRKSFVDEDLLPFDVELAYSLYAELLQPVEHIWRPAKSLIVATNGALGLLPLGLLPTGASSAGAGPAWERYAAYRHVPWLVRTHAITMVPSGASLRALRQLPPGSPKREPLIGFGDPFFSKQQADEAEKTVVVAQSATGSTTVRGPVSRRRALRSTDESRFSDLNRLPDTAEELKSIAAALSADPARMLHLGRRANEHNVKSLDLSRYRFIVFATHGLVPFQLGLTQPAIALSAPDVAGVGGDGLLTMEEVLALKLDADWVVLSACNSAAGAAEGAEAVSGLGRAFFYAGTRALLVTNWEVESLSARDLVTGIFKALADEPTLTRAEALRRSMVSLIDGPGLVESDGRTVRSYAHPYFWAPYSIIGDGGGGG